jgi:hypothetical protein
MIETLKTVLEGALERLRYQLTTYLPPLLAAIVLVLGAYVTAVFTRWLIYKIFKGWAIDKFLRQSGVAFLMDPSGRLRATRLVAETAYWCLLLSGVLLGLNAFGTDLTTSIARSIVSLLPKLVVAGLILLAGSWLGQYLSRSMLVWAVNENFPSPHRLAVMVRVVIMFVAVVVAADQLDFARNVFFAAFIIIVGGGVLAASLAIGLGKAAALRLFENRRNETGESADRSLWSHL